MEDCSEEGLHSLNCAFITGKRAPLLLGAEKKQSRKTSVPLETIITLGLVAASHTSTSNHAQNTELERDQRVPQAEPCNNQWEQTLSEDTHQPNFPKFSFLITDSFLTAKLPLQSALYIKPLLQHVQCSCLVAFLLTFIYFRLLVPWICHYFLTSSLVMW